MHLFQVLVIAWGWKRYADGKWTPLWTTLSEATKQYRELIKCTWKNCCILQMVQGQFEVYSVVLL